MIIASMEKGRSQKTKIANTENITSGDVCVSPLPQKTKASVHFIQNTEFKICSGEKLRLVADTSCLA